MSRRPPITDPTFITGNDVRGCTTAAQVMAKGRDLAFRVDTRPIAFADTGETIPDAFALARHDNGRKLAIVGKSYRVLQNAAALAPFDHLVARGVLAYHSAGTNDGGARVWIKATLPGIAVKPIGEARVGDTVSATVMLAHGHGGAGITTTAVIESLICLNGARRIDAGGVVRMRHTGDVEARVATAIVKVDLVQQEMDRLVTIGSDLTTRKPKDRDVVLDYLAAVYQQEAADLASSRKAIAIGNAFLQGDYIGADLPTRAGTWWGLYNAITEYCTHHHGRSPETRGESLVWGPNGAIVNRALDVAYVMGWSDLPAAEIASMTNAKVAALASDLRS